MAMRVELVNVRDDRVSMLDHQMLYVRDDVTGMAQHPWDVQIMSIFRDICSVSLILNGRFDFFSSARLWRYPFIL